MPAELETALADALKADEILVDPVVTVTILEYDSRPISVMGAVGKPVTFQARPSQIHFRFCIRWNPSGCH